MRLPLFCLLALSACSSEANHLGNPLMWPVYGLTTAVDNAAYGARRGEVEVFVTSHHPALIADLRAGGGATLTEAFDLARVPQAERGPHTLQMQSDLAFYENSPQALLIAIMVVSA